MYFRLLYLPLILGCIVLSCGGKAPIILGVSYSAFVLERGVSIEIDAQIDDDNIDSVKLFYKLKKDDVFHGLDMNNTATSGYFINLGPFFEKDDLFFYILATDRSGLTARYPSSDNYLEIKITPD